MNTVRTQAKPRPERLENENNWGITFYNLLDPKTRMVKRRPFIKHVKDRYSYLKGILQSTVEAVKDRLGMMVTPT